MSRIINNVAKAPATIYPYYELPNLEQGSDQWRKWRKGVVGVSEAPITPLRQFSHSVDPCSRASIA